MKISHLMKDNKQDKKYLIDLNRMLPNFQMELLTQPLNQHLIKETILN